MWLEQKRTGKWRKLTRALFLMAARDPTNSRAAVVNALLPRNEEETAILAGGETRKIRRQSIQKFDLFKTEPNAFETRLIHELFIKSIDNRSKAFNKRILPPGGAWMEDVSWLASRLAHSRVRRNDFICFIYHFRPTCKISSSRIPKTETTTIRSSVDS